MKQFTLQTERFQSRTEMEADSSLPTLSECRQFNRTMKGQLALVEQSIQVAHDRLMADANRNGLDETFVAGASATVILSVAASMMEFASFRVGKALDGAAFVTAARAAADSALDRPTTKRASDLAVSLDFSVIGKKSS